MPHDPELVALRGRMVAMSNTLKPSHDDTLSHCIHAQLRMIQKLLDATVEWIDTMLAAP